MICSDYCGHPPARWRARRRTANASITMPVVLGLAWPPSASRNPARWTEEGDLVDRFVLAKAKRRWACPTQAQALRSFMKRKQAQRRLLRVQIERSSLAEAIAKRELVRVTAKDGDE